MMENKIYDQISESGIIATLINNPEYIYYSENLKANHFGDMQNAVLYDAIRNLCLKGVTTIDTYNLVTALDELPQPQKLPVAQLNELVDLSSCMARNTVAEYKMLVDKVLEKAFRREMFTNLRKCEGMCQSDTTANLKDLIYRTMDDTIMSYSNTNEIPQFKNIVDKMWDKIEARQSEELRGSLFKFPTLNEYCTIDPGEFVCFGGKAKQGKSMILLNCAVDLCMKNKSVLYIDSELTTEAFTLRLISHLTGIKHNDLKWGRYGDVEAQRIQQAKDLVKGWNFTHIYLPRLDEQAIYSVVKKTKHMHGLDVLILDYLKSTREGDAYAVYAQMGRVADMIKNVLCGDMGIAGLGAVQLTDTGKIADSANIERSVSTMIKICKKTQDEIQADGRRCGNYKLMVTANRNGQVMNDDEYIDLNFEGDRILFEECEQHVAAEAV